MTALDWLIVAVFVVSLITAAANGLFVELFSVAGLIGGLLVGGMYYTRFARWLMHYVHSAPAADAFAFLLIAAGVLIAAGIAGRVLRWIFRKVGLGWADRLLGLVFGAVKGCVLVTLLVMIVAAFSPNSGWVLHSRLLPYFMGAAQQGSEMVPGTLGEKVRHGVRIFRKTSPPSFPGSDTVTF